MNIINWFHHLLNPHCEHCKDIAEDSKVCKSCETLTHQLEIANFEKKQLLQAVLDNQKPVPEQTNLAATRQPASIKNNISWAVRKQMLEAEDRKAASLRNEANKNIVDKLATDNSEIEELERSLGVGE